jgi:SAM-dependent methyltransferase
MMMMMMMLNLLPAILLALSGSVTLDNSPDQSPRRPKRSYAERTSARRKRTNQLLESILPPSGSGSLEEIEVPELEAPSIDWSRIHVDLDPQKGGNLQQDTPRSRRKRLQVEAFLHLCKELLPGIEDDKESTIVDAGSGAGNLAIPLAGLLQSHVLAIDMNQIALDRLEDRSREIPGCDVSTLCADLATAVLPDACSIVCSLHACGAATDMAIRMSTQYRLPFVMSPCCTGNIRERDIPPKGVI